MLATATDEITFAAGTSGLYDLLFDDNGNITEGVAGKKTPIVAGGIAVGIPKDSRLYFRNKKLIAVDAPQNIKIEINGVTYTVSATNEGPSLFFDFKSGTIDDIVITDGHSLAVEEMSIPLKADSKISFRFSEGNYTVSKCYVAKPVTVKEYLRKGKTREVEVKEGRRLSLNEGKVVDTGR